MNKQHEKILQLDCAANLIKRDLQELPKKRKKVFLRNSKVFRRIKLQNCECLNTFVLILLFSSSKRLCYQPAVINNKIRKKGCKTILYFVVPKFYIYIFLSFFIQIIIIIMFVLVLKGLLHKRKKKQEHIHYVLKETP